MLKDLERSSLASTWMQHCYKVRSQSPLFTTKQSRACISCYVPCDYNPCSHKANPDLNQWNKSLQIGSKAKELLLWLHGPFDNAALHMQRLNSCIGDYAQNAHGDICPLPIRKTDGLQTHKYLLTVGQ